jgi:hypothetical protein
MIAMNSPRDRCTVACIAAAIPRFSGNRSNRIRGSSKPAMISGVASLEPSSVITNSKSSNVWSRILRTAALTNGA